MNAQDKSDIRPGDGVALHDGVNILVPTKMSYARALIVLETKRAMDEEVITLDRTFPYRPGDGAIATEDVLGELYGLSHGVGGWRPPDTLSVALADGTTRTVAWSEVEVPAMVGGQGGSLYLMTDRDKTGHVFMLRAMVPRKATDEVNTLFDAIAERLRTHSIYRGQVITDAGRTFPGFVDLTQFDGSTITFSDQTLDTLDAALWHTIRNREAVRGEGIPIKRAVLAEGPYGTGKTSALMLTAQIATANGWTFVLAKPGDSIGDTIALANLYAPAVVGIEDLDTQARGGNPTQLAELLDVFDGATSKDAQVMLIATTNRVDTIAAGMLRPGRLDYIVHVGALDAAGMQRLVKAVIPQNKLAEHIDWPQVTHAMTGFEPAFVRATADRAKTWALREYGPGYVIDTGALVAAAKSLHGQLNLLRNALAPKDQDATVDSVFRRVVTEAVDAQVNGSIAEDGEETRELTRHAADRLNNTLVDLAERLGETVLSEGAETRELVRERT